MKILIHSCCAPCTIFPLEQIMNKGDFNSVEVFFFNPNIHPFLEYRSRLNSLKEYLNNKNITIRIPEDYNLDLFLQKVVNNEQNRCLTCYDIRLKYLCEYAKENSFDAVTTTLLYSKYQNHSLIKNILEKYTSLYSIKLVYEDFRNGWQYGIDESIKYDMYRQKYCGCIYSEQERFDNKFKKKLRKKKKSIK